MGPVVERAVSQHDVPGAFSGPDVVLSMGLGHASPGDSGTQSRGLARGL